MHSPNEIHTRRYWQTSSPQKTLFVPGPKLVKGTNTIVVLELHNGTKDASMRFVAEPLLMSWSPSPAPSPVKCDPAAPGKKGSSVRMANESPKLAYVVSPPHPPTPFLRARLSGAPCKCNVVCLFCLYHYFCVFFTVALSLSLEIPTCDELS